MKGVCKDHLAGTGTMSKLNSYILPPPEHVNPQTLKRAANGHVQELGNTPTISREQPPTNINTALSRAQRKLGKMKKSPTTNPALTAPQATTCKMRSGKNSVEPLKMFSRIVSDRM